MAKKKIKEDSSIFVSCPRPNWTIEQQIRLWVRCGGRCSLCNTNLLTHEYFGVKGKIGEFAHIIAHSEYGTRPNNCVYPSDYLESEDNIIVLCPTCHTLIDKKCNEGLYSEKILRQWKAEHENKISNQTKPTKEAFRRAIRFCAPIGEQMIYVTDDQIREALFPNYFVGDGRPAEIIISLSNNERQTDYWERAEHELISQFKSEVAPCIKVGDKLAVFGIAPIPLLVLFGSLLADYNVTNIQNLFRNKDNKWAWPSNIPNGELEFKIHRPSKLYDTLSKKILVLSLTSNIRSRISDKNALVWEVTPIEGPHYEAITNISRLNEFGKIILDVLDEISKVPGYEIHVYSAIPNSAAIMFGTKYMKKANNTLYLYDFVSSEGKDVFALKINSL